MGLSLSDFAFYDPSNEEQGGGSFNFFLSLERVHCQKTGQACRADMGKVGLMETLR